MAAKGSKLTSRWRWQLRGLLSSLWVRASLYGVAAVLTALASSLAADFLPDDLGARIGADAVDSILTVIATSMLTVTTFSLGIMLTALNTASGGVTPRAARLLVEDPVSQNSLATFLGSFLFSLVGIIALKAGIYGEQGRVLLFCVTLGVVAVIFLTFIRWIRSLQGLGRMSDTVRRIERAAGEALEARLEHPYLGGRKWDGTAPEGAVALRSGETGYVQHIDLEWLESQAREASFELWIEALPGAFVHRGSVLAFGQGLPADEEERRTLTRGWTVGEERNFDQDPRLGFIVLSEVASRALSPAVNDPGTAIDILGRGVRLLGAWRERQDPELRHPHLWVRPLEANDFVEDLFRPIGRDGAGLVEVQVRLRKSLAALAEMLPEAFGVAARRQAAEAQERAEAAMGLEADREALRACPLPEAARERGARDGDVI